MRSYGQISGTMYLKFLACHMWKKHADIRTLIICSNKYLEVPFWVQRSLNHFQSRNQTEHSGIYVPIWCPEIRFCTRRLSLHQKPIYTHTHTQIRWRYCDTTYRWHSWQKIQELISRLDSRTLPLEPRHRCTSSALSTCLRNDVLASCLLTKHAPDDVIVTHALLYDLSIGPIFNDLERLDLKVTLRRWI